MADSDFWGGAAPSRALALVPQQQPQPSSISQRSQRSLPGPAGRLGGTARPTLSSAGTGGGSGGGGGGSGAGWAGRDPDFQSRPWRQALQEADVHEFDETVEPFRGTTVRAAAALQQNGVLGSLLAVVATVRRCHSGEAFVRLKDPTGAIGGTLTKAVLQAEPDIRPGAVVRLRRITVLRTPPPRSLNHLCITLEAVVQVIPPAEEPEAPLALPEYQAPQQQRQQPPPPQQQRAAFPALPAPPSASLQPTSQRQLLPPPQQQQAASKAVMLPPPPRQPVPPGPSPSFAWPSLAAGSMQPQQQQQSLQQPPPSQQQQQQQRPQQAAPSFAWPSIGAPAGNTRREAAQHSMQQQAALPSVRQTHAFGMPPGAQQQRPAQSESVNFSMPNLDFSQEPQWQDDATSGPANQRAQAPTPASQVAGAMGAGSGWLAGLLAEADFNPFLASQGPPPPARPPLAERQPSSAVPSQQLSPPGMPASKRQCTATAGPAAAAQRQQSPPVGSNAFADGIDDLELDD